MGNFRFGQQVQGNVYSLGSGRPATATSRNRTSASCPAPMPGGSSSMSNRMPSPSGGYDITRFNPAYDRLEEGSVIEDWIPRDLPGINKMLRIIYTRDAIAGPAVDIMSNLPWSEFDVVGVDDPKIRQFYEDAAQVFGDKAQELPAITIEYLALGRFCASLIYNETKGYWTDFVPHDSDFLTITPIPVRNCDPKIDLVMSPGYRQFVTSDDYRDQAARDRLPDYLLQKMQSGQPIPLDPLNTMYIRRKSSPYDFVGTSIYTRIIPFWALEKSLMNSSVTAARRRAGNILHLTCGLDERWEPTMEEMEDLAGLFVQADEDPVGAVVATRTGVEAQEVRQGGQLWKWSDEWQIFSEGKMRGLGISEALLSGDATYNNMEQAKSVFTEQIRTLRFFLTQQVYIKQFKILARAHGFVKRKKAELDHRVRTTPSPVQRNQPFVEDYQDINLENLSQTDAMDLPEEDLLVPNIQWKKSLLPEGDREYLELLSTLKEEGVPIPLKVWAARGGYDLHEAMEMLEEDLQIRKKVKNWQDKAGVNEDDEAFGEAEAQPSHIFWDRGQQFMQLRKKEAQACLQEIVNTVYQPGKRQALADSGWVMKTLKSRLKNHRKVELMAYVMMRLGVARSLPISPETCKDIAEWFANNETLKPKIRMRELQYLAQAVAHRDTKKVNVTELAQATVDQIKDKDSVLAKTMDASFKSKALAPTSPTLFTGQLS